MQAAHFAELYLHWLRVKFSPVRGSTNVLWFPIVLLFFLLDKKSLRQRDRQRERNGRGKREPNTRCLNELKQLIRARSKATSFSHCLVLVSSRLCLSPLLLKRTQGSSLALIKTNGNAPQLPINQSVEHKKGQINERCVVTVNWSWSPNGVWIGWPYYDLWLKYWIYVIYGFYTPMSHRSHLSFSPPNCAGKTKFYMWSKWECKIQQNRQETGLKGGFRFKVKNIISMWIKS